jgi:hypothetical protein
MYITINKRDCFSVSYFFIFMGFDLSGKIKLRITPVTADKPIPASEKLPN